MIFTLREVFLNIKRIPLGVILVTVYAFNSELDMLHGKQVSASHQNVSNLGQIALEMLQRPCEVCFWAILLGVKGPVDSCSPCSAHSVM